MMARTVAETSSRADSVALRTTLTPPRPANNVFPAPRGLAQPMAQPCPAQGVPRPGLRAGSWLGPGPAGGGVE